MKVLVTGANGFIGRAVLLQLNHMPGVIALGSVRRQEKFVDVGAVFPQRFAPTASTAVVFRRI
jgi:nucleoside-diphosphate-sugar epimerase